MIMTYVSNLADVQTAINIAKRLEGGLSLANQYQNTYLLKEEVA